MYTHIRIYLYPHTRIHVLIRTYAYTYTHICVYLYCVLQYARFLVNVYLRSTVRLLSAAAKVAEAFELAAACLHIKRKGKN